MYSIKKCNFDIHKLETKLVKKPSVLISRHCPFTCLGIGERHASLVAFMSAYL
jgi:hypothetical protein